MSAGCPRCGHADGGVLAPGEELLRRLLRVRPGRPRCAVSDEGTGDAAGEGVCPCRHTFHAVATAGPARVVRQRAAVEDATSGATEGRATASEPV